MNSRWKILGKKVMIAILTIFVAMTFTFVIVRQMPGDILHTLALQIQVERGASYQEAREIAKTMINYDPTVPVHIQYGRYLHNLLFRGQLGYSLSYRIPVSTIIARALPWTLLITVTSALVSFCGGTFLGVMAAWKRKGTFDFIITLYSTVSQAIPDFFIGLFLLLIFGLTLRWFPARGAYSPYVDPGFNFPFILDVLYHSILPITAFSLQAMGGWALSMRASAMSVLGEDYINVARAKGLKEVRILVNYMGRNAIIPLITGLAVTLGTNLGGSMLVESIFGYPGLGYFLARAIATRDYTLIQGLLLLTTVAVIVANLFADVLYTWLDPRISLE